jgi:hypothetical protein
MNEMEKGKYKLDSEWFGHKMGTEYIAPDSD